MDVSVCLVIFCAGERCGKGVLVNTPLKKWIQASDILGGKMGNTTKNYHRVQHGHFRIKDDESIPDDYSTHRQHLAAEGCKQPSRVEEDSQGIFILWSTVHCSPWR